MQSSLCLVCFTLPLQSNVSHLCCFAICTGKGVGSFCYTEFTLPSPPLIGRPLCVLSMTKYVRFEFKEYVHEHRLHRDECDAIMTLTMLQVQIHSAKGVTNGTMFLAGNDVQIMQGARLHLDRGDLLVTASNFAFGPAPGSLTDTDDNAIFALSF